MSRIYNVSIAAPFLHTGMDLIDIFAGTLPLKLREFYIIADNGSPSTAQSFAIIISRLSGIITPGSGGQTLNCVPLISTDSAASFTARGGDTTQASSTGTAYGAIAAGANIFNSWHYLPPQDMCLVLQAGEALQIGTGGLTTGTNYSAYLTIEELA